MEDILQDDLSWIDSYVENEELYKIFIVKIRVFLIVFSFILVKKI